MTDKFRNKYRSRSHRMPQWDYSNNGKYFITLVTQNSECNLGQINNGEMIFSGFGKIVNDEWLESFEIRNELFLDEYIIMPNHLHAIVVLNKNGIINMDNKLHGSDVDTHGRAYLQPPNQSIKKIQKQPCIRKPKSISSFIGGFKSAVNTKIDDYIDEKHLKIPKYNRNNHFFQSNYHDHIIRNNAEYQRIKNYIINNPVKWDNDKFNPKN
ncbi:MAG: transposase [Bacteroidales bacterium]